MQDEQLDLDLGDQPEVIVELTEDGDPIVEEIEISFGDDGFNANLADRLDDAVLEEVGQGRVNVLRSLKQMRSDLDDFLIDHMALLGMGPRQANATVEDGCDAIHPLLMENIVKFQAKAIQQLWPAEGPVRTRLRGGPSMEKERIALRVRQHMNYQLSVEVPGAFSDRERSLFRVAALGTNIMKAAWNPLLNTLDPIIVPMDKFFVDPAVTHLRYADEFHEVMDLSPHKMASLIKNGQFRNCDEKESTIRPTEIETAINEAQGISDPTERPGFQIGEAYCYLDLDGADEMVEAGDLAPYIVHYNVESGKVYSITRGWLETDSNRNRRLYHVAETLIPGFGFYGLGYIHLIGDLAKGSTSVMRALVDAGMLANFQGGFKSKDAKLSNSEDPLQFGEWRDVSMSPGELQNAFYPLPAKEPSQTLYQVLQFLVGSGQKFADTTDEVVNNATNYGPVATTLALLEASQRFYSSIHKRLHASQQELFGLLGRLNFENLPARVDFVVGEADNFVRNTDYDPAIVDIIPASDPNALTESQRVAKAQIELDTAQRFPAQHDVREALRRFYVAMGTENIDAILPPPDRDAVTADPLTEIQVAMRGKPIKAAMGQDHQAHIAVKSAFLQSPQMQGSDPSTAVGRSVLQANLGEHRVLLFASQIQLMAQQQGLPPDDPRVQGQMAEMLMQQSAANNPQQQANTEQMMLQLQAEELELSERRIESQNVRDSAALAIKNWELQLKELSMMAETEDKRLKREMEASSKILDNAAKMAEIETKRLSNLARSG